MALTLWRHLNWDLRMELTSFLCTRQKEKLCTLESLLLYGSTLTRRILFQFGVAAGSKILNDPKTDSEHQLFTLLSEQRRWFLFILEDSVRQRSDKMNQQDTWNEFNGIFLCQNFCTKLSPCLGLSLAFRRLDSFFLSIQSALLRTFGFTEFL